MALVVRRRKRTQVTTSDIVEDQKDVLQNFMQTISRLLSSLVVTYPECLQTKSANFVIQRMMSTNNIERQKVLISDWRKTMKPFYDDCFRHDLTILDKPIKVFQELHMKEKVTDPDISETSRSHFWDYIIKLNQFAEAYHSVPQSIQERLSGIDIKIDDLQNPKVMLNVVQQMLSKTSPQELMKLMSNAPQLMRAGLVPNFKDIMAVMGSKCSDILKSGMAKSTTSTTSSTTSTKKS